MRHFSRASRAAHDTRVPCISTAAMAVLAGCLSLALVGCGQTQDSASTSASSGGDSETTAGSGSGTSSLSIVTSSDATASTYSDGEVAISVNGTLVYENDVTAYIQAQRDKFDLSDDSAWGSYLADHGQDGSAIRDSALENYIDTILLDNAIAERGISVSDEEVSDRLEQMREYYDSFGENGWEQVRNAMGYSSDEAFSSHLARQMLIEKLRDSVCGSIALSDEDVQAYLDDHASEYAGKRASMIILPDLASAEQVKALIDSGAITFPEAALTYSLAYSNAYTSAYAASQSSSAADSGSSSTTTQANTDVMQLDGTTGTEAVVASNAEDAQTAVGVEKTHYITDEAWQSALDSAGDCGWQKETDIENAAAGAESSMGGLALEVLSTLEVGQISDPVSTVMGAQLVMCTESYDPETDGTQLSDMPEDLQEQVRADALEQAKEDAWNAFGQQLYMSAAIDATPMPAGLPYDVEVPSGSGTVDESASSLASGSGSDSAASGKLDAAANATGASADSSAAASSSDGEVSAK